MADKIEVHCVPLPAYRLKPGLKIVFSGYLIKVLRAEEGYDSETINVEFEVLAVDGADLAWSPGHIGARVLDWTSAVALVVPPLFIDRTKVSFSYSFDGGIEE